MFKRIVAVIISLALPATVSAGPIKQAAERAASELAAVKQPQEGRSRARFWTGISLIAGGGVLAALSGIEIGDDESGPDDGEDFDDSDDGEDSDGWGGKALLGGGIAAATVGGVVLLTGRRGPGARVSVQPGRIVVRHSVRF